MKITANLDSTPEELRAFMGLPDVGPMQRAIMDQLERRMIESMEQLSPATMMREWFSPSGSMQQAMMNLFQAGLMHSPTSSRYSSGSDKGTDTPS